ncbi:hypothetical protein F4801DRAFT_10365 [Xylaria longipes]|nr:hypothetical protein F4801DRAFT_10365 [Xylaria longipes]
MDEDEEQTVASRTLIAEYRFNDLITQLKSGSKTSPISIEAATDALDRFKLWAGNIGARQHATSPVSLEARLLAAKRILEQVKDLLDDLILALDDLLEIASGSRENRRIIHNNLFDDEDFDDEDLSSLEHQLEANAGPGLEKHESQDILDVISDCIRSLLKISILIRKATPRDRFARALQGDDPFIDQFDINYVAEKHSKLNKPESEWLCARLGRAITKRRQFLRYSRQHGSRIAGLYGNDRERSKHHVLSKDSGEVTAFDISLNTQMRYPVGTNLSGSVAAHTHAYTKASTLDITTLQQLMEDEANKEDARSFISADSSRPVESENSRLHLPSLEELSRDNSIFECPFCLGLQTFTKESAWRRHAYRDLKAYVCTLGQGKCDSEMFGDSRTWFDHELQCHRKQWVCVICSKGPFRTPADFKSHTKNKHANVLVNDGQLESLMGASQRAVDAIAADECPFCNEWETILKNNTPVPQSMDSSGVVITVEPVQFRRHVASHMEQLALFAIPRNMGDDESDEDTNKVAALSRSTVNAEPRSPMFEISNTNEGWIPDPPLHIAAASGDLVTFRVLLEEGADIHLRGETWGTVLDAACSCQQSTRDDILSLLRSHCEGRLFPDTLLNTEIHDDQLIASSRPSYVDVTTRSQSITDDPHPDVSIFTEVEEPKKPKRTRQRAVSQVGWQEISHTTPVSETMSSTTRTPRRFSESADAGYSTVVSQDTFRSHKSKN